MDQFSCVTTFILWQGIPILEVLEMVSIGSIEFCAIVELSSSALQSISLLDLSYSLLLETWHLY